MRHITAIREETIPVDPAAVIVNQTVANLREFGRSRLHLPGMPAIRRLTSKLLAVTEPPRWLFMRRHPAQATARECGPLTVMSANLWHDWPRQRHMIDRLELFARLVERQRVEILMLQEVSRSTDLDVDRWLANRLGMAYVYARANGHPKNGFEEGPAIYSRFPLGQPHLKQLDDGANPFVRRLALGVEVHSPCGKLMVFSAHLGLLPHENKHHLEQLRSWVNGKAGGHSALIGGDFNSGESTPRMQQLQAEWQDTFRQVHPTAQASTHALRAPGGIMLSRQRLDYVFLKNGFKPWGVQAAGHLSPEQAGLPGNLAHSDHQPVLVHLVPAE